MPPPPPWSSGMVIDLTGSDDEELGDRLQPVVPAASKVTAPVTTNGHATTANISTSIAPVNNQTAVPKAATRPQTFIPVPPRPSWWTTPQAAKPPPAIKPVVTATPVASQPITSQTQLATAQWSHQHKRPRHNYFSGVLPQKAYSKLADKGQRDQVPPQVPLPASIRQSIEPTEVAQLAYNNNNTHGLNRAPSAAVHSTFLDQEELPHKQPHRPELDLTPARNENTRHPSLPLQRHVSPPKLLQKKPPRNTVQRQHAQARAPKWQGGRTYEPAPTRTSSSTPEQTQHRSYGIIRRPYLSAPERRKIVAGTTIRLDRQDSQALHVDFAEDESHFLRKIARFHYKRPATGGRAPLRDLRHILKKDADCSIRDAILKDVREGFTAHEGLYPPSRLLSRTVDDVDSYLVDLIVRRHNSYPQCLRLEPARSNPQPVNKISHMLFARELTGPRGFGALRRYHDFDTVFRTAAEDRLEPRMEFTNCAGDIVTISWLSDNDFICGTTTHSDQHNQQYNKPGNLALGNVAKKQLVAHPDHHIRRPIVERGENALESMRHSQDPWLFTSVVSSDYSDIHQLAFTAGFDHTAKVWRRENGTMTNVGTWTHNGRVNFVVASAGELGLIATATDVSEKNVRVYHLDQLQRDLTHAQFDEYSCSRIAEAGFVQSDKWSYYPAAISWGLAPAVRHLLLVGYSPRAHEADKEDEIPEDKLETGEVCMFDTILHQPVRVSGAAMQNVFDVVWHPTQAMFAVATSTSPGNDARISTHRKTQVRVYWWSEEHFKVHKTLDCPAADINMLTLRPNSKIYSYITASCTDSKVYVWDTRLESELPMCVLKHGDPIDEILGDREHFDVGVTFTAWGSTSDRLYTGSSDGVVKVWNIRQGRARLVKDLIELNGPITAGAFSPDLRKLAIGDGTGKICIMTQDEDDDEPPLLGLRVDVAGRTRTIRPPRAIKLHPELPPPFDPTTTRTEPEDGPSIGSEWLKKESLVLKPGLGVFQGPKYAEIGLYRRDLHLGEDPTGPLLARHQAVQQTDRQPTLWQVRWQRDAIVVDTATKEKDFAMETRQLQNDLEKLQLDVATEAQLKAERVEYDASKVDYVFPFEDED